MKTMYDNSKATDGMRIEAMKIVEEDYQKAQDELPKQIEWLKNSLVGKYDPPLFEQQKEAFIRQAGTKRNYDQVLNGLIVDARRKAAPPKVLLPNITDDEIYDEEVYGSYDEDGCYALYKGKVYSDNYHYITIKFDEDKLEEFSEYFNTELADKDDDDSYYYYQIATLSGGFIQDDEESMDDSEFSIESDEEISEYNALVLTAIANGLPSDFFTNQEDYGYEIVGWGDG